MEIQVGNKIEEVTLLSKEGNLVSLDIDGTIYDVDIAMLPSGVCSILHNGNSYNASLMRTEGTSHYTVNLNYSTYQIDVLSSEAKYMRLHKKHNNAVQADDITAPMPCKIVKVYCHEGDEMKAGDTLFTMEAMKMQSNYKVGRDCIIKSVKITEGDTVRADQTLVSLEPEK